jgi:hypothetical protein
MAIRRKEHLTNGEALSRPSTAGLIQKSSTFCRTLRPRAMPTTPSPTARAQFMANPSTTSISRYHQRLSQIVTRDELFDFSWTPHILKEHSEAQDTYPTNFCTLSVWPILHICNAVIRRQRRRMDCILRGRSLGFVSENWMFASCIDEQLQWRSSPLQEGIDHKCLPGLGA